MSRSHRSAGRHGFTLVELLVVIGIISVLIGILLPALAKARAQGNKAQCLSNLHQLGLSLQEYVIANKGVGYFAYTSVTPIPAPHVSPGPGATYFQYWFAAYFSYDTPNTWDYTLGYLTQYLRNPKIIDCPELGERQNSAVSGEQTLPRIGYSYNSNVSYTTVKTFSQIRSGFETPALVDGALVATSAAQGILGGIYPATSCSKPSSKNPGFSGRHSGQGNVLWYDGHATTVAPYVCHSAASYGTAQAAYVNTYVAANIGYLTPATPSGAPESTLVFNATPALATPMNLDYYFWLSKRNMK